MIIPNSIGDKPVKAVLDAYNPVGSTCHVNFNTSKTSRWRTDARKNHIVPGVNNLQSYGRWAFAEFTEVFQIQAEFEQLVNSLVQS